MIILVYVDDWILISKEDFTIQKFISPMKTNPEGFELTEEGTMNAYLSVDIYPLPYGKGFTLYQPLSIDWFIQALDFEPNTAKGTTNNTLSGYPLLNKDGNSPARKVYCKYRGINGMLGYLQGTTRPETAMATHKCARFNNDPHLSHEQSVKLIRRYLLDNRDKGMIYRPDTLIGLECYVDADFQMDGRMVILTLWNHHCFTHRFCYYLCWIPNSLGEKNTNRNSPQYYGK